MKINLVNYALAKGLRLGKYYWPENDSNARKEYCQEQVTKLSSTNKGASYGVS